MIKMIVARHDETIFQQYLKTSLMRLTIQVCEIHNDTIKENNTMTKKYNKGVDAIKPELKDEDIVCFCHEDVKILDPQFMPKLEMAFREKSDVGLLGVIGTSQMEESGAWWQTDNSKLRGHIIQENNGKEFHLVKGKVGYFDDMVAIDGLFFAIRGKVINEGLRFNEDLSGYDFYDIDVCLKVLEMGWKVGCADILVQHKSPGEGSLNENWSVNRDIVINNLKESKYNFPIVSKDFEK
jgi:hypothetical protein